MTLCGATPASTHSISGWTAIGGLVRNPHLLDRTACGSSAGSGAAVAAGLVTLAVGTETDGSVTCPAAANGVVGLKPTVGLVSRTFIVPISPEQDTPGPMTRTVADAALLYAAMIGRDSVVGASESLGNDVSSLDAIVLFPGAASIVDIADFRTIAGQSAEFRNLLARHEQAIFSQCQQSAACNAAHSVEARLSRWLLRARDLWDGTTLPMTQELLARLIGVQRNAISIVAHSLQQDGIISYSRGRIEIMNSQALQATACECYQTVAARYEHLLVTARDTQR